MTLGPKILTSLSEQIARANADRRQKQKGTLSKLKGLSRPVEVYWDDAGVPHLYAATKRDLFLAQGWITAKDRAFQLDFSRRAISGRLAELLGTRPIEWRSLTVHLKDRSIAEADRLIRTLGLRRAAEASFAVLSEHGKDALDAYADGVSQAFLSMKRRKPLEHRILSAQLEPWSPVDSLSIIKGMAFEMSFAWRAVLLHDAIAKRLSDDPERIRLLFPHWPAHAPPPAAWSLLREAGAETVALEERFRAFTALGGAHVGSNAWVVSGEKSASGKPLLAGDPHLMLNAPSPHYAIHLCSPDLEVAGSSIPGVPGVVIGHNRDVAWSLTAACGSDADIFVEEVDLSKKAYKTGSEWSPLESRTERLKIKGEPDLVFEVFTTRHGPLIDEVTRPLADRKAGFAHALRWTGHDAAPDMDGLLKMQSARDFHELREGMALLSAPALNFIYADTKGHIGWQLAGRFPVRKNGSDGLVPSDGASNEAEWTRYLTLDELPHLYDPPNGFIVSANTKPVDDNYPWPLGSTWEPYHRYQRIEQLLQERAAKRKLTIEDMIAIQLDQRSSWAETITEKFFRPALKDASFTDPIERKAVELLLAWDHIARVDSAAAAIFYSAYDALLQASLQKLLGDDLLTAYLELLNVSVLPFERLFDEPDPPILRHVDRPALARHAIEAAVHRLKEAQGSKPETWRWGSLHQVWHRHRMHEVKALRPLLSIGPFEAGGDGLCVNNAHWHHSHPFEVIIGPGLRMVLDLAGWDRAKFILNSGQSGDPASPRYRDHAGFWSAGRYHRLVFGEEGRVGQPDLLAP